MTKRIEPVSDDHRRLRRPPREIEARAKELLEPVNQQTYRPEATQTLAEFVDRVYFPNLESQKRASTVKGYKARWESQLKARCGGYRLRDFRTSDGQKLLVEIAEQNPGLYRSALHLRSLLIAISSMPSGRAIWTVRIRCARLELRRGPRRRIPTPTRSKRLRVCSPTFRSLRTRSLRLRPLPGLRRSELAGLLWENYSGDEISVTRSVWEGHVDEPKTRKSKAPVPVINPLRKILDTYREQ